jgi:hypothetical protein
MRLLAFTVVVGAGCTERNPAYCDEANPCVTGVCDLPSHTCTATPDASGAVADASLDGPLGTPIFDVIYAREWRLAYFIDVPMEGWIAIVNRRPIAAISGDDITVVSVEDDHPSGGFDVQAISDGSVIGPDIAGGELSDVMEPLANPLIAEERGDLDQRYLSILPSNLPQGFYDVAVTVTVALENARVELPMTFHVEGDPVTWQDPLAASRVTAYSP